MLLLIVIVVVAAVAILGMKAVGGAGGMVFSNLTKRLTKAQTLSLGYIIIVVKLIKTFPMLSSGVLSGFRILLWLPVAAFSIIVPVIVNGKIKNGGVMRFTKFLVTLGCISSILDIISDVPKLAVSLTASGKSKISIGVVAIIIFLDLLYAIIYYLWGSNAMHYCTGSNVPDKAVKEQSDSYVATKVHNMAEEVQSAVSQKKQDMIDAENQRHQDKMDIANGTAYNVDGYTYRPTGGNYNSGLANQLSMDDLK